MDMFSSATVSLAMLLVASPSEWTPTTPACSKVSVTVDAGTSNITTDDLVRELPVRTGISAGPADGIFDMRELELVATASGGGNWSLYLKVHVGDLEAGPSKGITLEAVNDVSDLVSQVSPEMELLCDDPPLPPRPPKSPSSPEPPSPETEEQSKDETPKDETPKTDTPKDETLKDEMPKGATPKTDISTTDASTADAPTTNALSTNAVDQSAQNPFQPIIPRWAKILGMSLGAGLAVAGGVLLSLDGKCKNGDTPTSENVTTTCRKVWENTGIGYSLIGIGGGLFVGATVWLAVDEVRLGRTARVNAMIAWTIRF